MLLVRAWHEDLETWVGKYLQARSMAIESSKGSLVNVPRPRGSEHDPTGNQAQSQNEQKGTGNPHSGQK